MSDNPTVEELKSFHQEISIMKSAGQHPNIVSLIGYCTLYNKPLLVVEYCSKGDLQTYLKTVKLTNALQVKSFSSLSQTENYLFKLKLLFLDLAEFSKYRIPA